MVTQGFRAEDPPALHERGRIRHADGMRRVLTRRVGATLLAIAVGGCADDAGGEGGGGDGGTTGGDTADPGGTGATGGGSTDAGDVLGPPVFTPSGGPFFGSVDVEISVGHTDAAIHYTIDGSPVTQDSPRYAGPIAIAATTILRARGFVEGVDPGAPGSQAYFATHGDLEAFSSNIPIVVIDSFEHDINAESGHEGDRPIFPRRLVYAAVIDAPTGGRASMGDTPAFSGRGGMKVRGNSSQILPKKQYSLETWDEDDLDREVALLGMPAESDWVLHAPYGDKALMRNHLAYEWSNDLGHYAPRTRHVELFFNWNDAELSMDDYAGVYLLVEKIKRASARVDIAKLEPTDVAEPEVSGGYIVKVDVPDADESPFRTAMGTPGDWTGFIHVYPDDERIVPEQHEWLLAYLDELEAVLYGPTFDDATGGWRELADEASFVHYHLLTEALKNADSYYASRYMHKDRDGPLAAGPVWDWNVSFGGTTDWNTENTAGWLHEQVGPFWFDRMFEGDAFRQAWIDRWTAVRADVLATDRLVADVDATAALLEEAQQRNFARWPILGEVIEELPHLNPAGYDERDTYAKEVDYLRGWLVERLEWIDANLDQLPRG